MALVEAAVETLDFALAAERAGADRIELCVNLSDGGTTPGTRLMSDVVQQVRVPVFALIRPRAGDFFYSADEFEQMARDIESAGTIGVDGIVTGVLTADARVDVRRTRVLHKVASGLPVTFHRAIDVTTDLATALEAVIETGASRVLSSGGAETALEGIERIGALVTQARGRIKVIAGGGIREHNARDVIERSGVGEVHGRLIDEAQMRGLVNAVKA